MKKDRKTGEKRCMEISLNAYGKINLGLDVVRRREDGYHEVKMVMQTVNLYDRLVFRDIDDDRIIIESDSDELPDVENNIIYKSYMLLKKAYGISRGLHVNVEKHIPVAAGMAGGSADAAATLVAVNRIFELGLSEQQLMEYGVRIGADVPYCIMQGTALAEGIGEVLSPLPPMPECWILIAKPNIGVSTKWVYENLHVDTLDRNQHPDIDILVDALKEGDVCAVAERMGNILETVTVRRHPEIESIRRMMEDHGSLGARMSGSGPTVFGVYDNDSKDTAQKLADELAQSELIQAVHVVRPYNRYGKR